MPHIRNVIGTIKASVANGRYARALVDVTNRVGVDVNLAFRLRHKSHVLQFVAGLGPRTAKLLLLNMPGKGGHLKSRLALLEMNEWVGRRIFMNAAGFLRIIDENDAEPEVLDGTRVHPENYGLARKMAASALDLLDEIQEDCGAAPCAKVMEPSNCLKLDDLDLDLYATMVEKDGRSGLRLTLYDIKDELQFPFRELRRPFEPSKEAARLYDVLADEPAASGRPDLMPQTTAASAPALRRRRFWPLRLLAHRRRHVVLDEN
jgi:transcriptional accessory protein Tex/SPT6